MHEGLLYKLKCNGVSGDLLILICTFLTHRQKHVLLTGKCSRWATVSAGVPQGSVLGPLFFLVYINDIIDNVRCDSKLFADDTSLCSVVRNDRSIEELNRDLDLLRLWSWQWKMHFNVDKTEEVICLTKRDKPLHDPLTLGTDDIDRQMEHKHIGIALVSRSVLDQVYKLYVRPHLDYDDIIYHRYDPEMILNVTK